MEIEAKYRATAHIRSKDVESLDLGPFSPGPRTTHKLRDSLIDTVDRRIAAHGHALRVRRDGDQTLLTLKGPAHVQGSLHSRPEWEAEIQREHALDRSSWPPEIRRRVQELAGEEPLEEIVRVRNRRNVWNVYRGQALVGELALDRGEIRAGGDAAPVEEIEFELKAGGTGIELAQVSACLTRALPLEPEPLSKLERGLALLDRRTGESLREAAARVAMQPDAPLAEAGRSVLARHLRSLLQALPVARKGEDPEGVHDARVAIRRLRAVLDTLGQAVYTEKRARSLRRKLARLSATLGKVRDADVLLARLEQARSGGAAKVRRKRGAAHRALVASLRKRSTARLLDRLDRFATTPGAGVRSGAGDESVAPTLVRDHAGSVLWRRHEAVHAYEPWIPGAPVATLHRLRVEVKRLRYALELFEPALGEPAHLLLDALVAAQDHLGDLHDADLAAARASDTNNEDTRKARDRLHADAPRALAPLMDRAWRERLATLVARL